MKRECCILLLTAVLLSGCSGENSPAVPPEIASDTPAAPISVSAEITQEANVSDAESEPPETVSFAGDCTEALPEPSMYPAGRRGFTSQESQNMMSLSAIYGSKTTAVASGSCRTYGSQRLPCIAAAA